MVTLQLRGNTSASDERDAGCLRDRDPDVRMCDRAIVAAVDGTATVNSELFRWPLQAGDLPVLRFNLTHRDWRGDQPIGGPREVQVARQMGPSWRPERELHQRLEAEAEERRRRRDLKLAERKRTERQRLRMRGIYTPTFLLDV